MQDMLMKILHKLKYNRPKAYGIINMIDKKYIDDKQIEHILGQIKKYILQYRGNIKFVKTKQRMQTMIDRECIERKKELEDIEKMLKL